ncbi:MAG: hypothetical protein IRZ16_01340 [Myxococcaceae bacterium]|nr:hypothetical protein [Myxococcaceae bacterium]
MADHQQDELAPDMQPRLQELGADRPDFEVQQVPGPAPIEQRMQQVVNDLLALPTAAQLAVLRAFVPALLEALDVADRAFWAREIVGEGVPEIPTLTA